MIEVTQPRSARFIPWLFVIGMLVVVAVNGALVYFAATTWSGIAVDKAYERGLAYNQALSVQAKETALGWAVEARLRTDGPEPVLVVKAADRNGRPLTDLQIESTVERPLGAPETRHLTLSPIERGTYAAPLPSLESGQWDAHLAIARGDERLHVTQRLLRP